MVLDAGGMTAMPGMIVPRCTTFGDYTPAPRKTVGFLESYSMRDHEPPSPPARVHVPEAAERSGGRGRSPSPPKKCFDNYRPGAACASTPARVNPGARAYATTSTRWPTRASGSPGGVRGNSSLPSRARLMSDGAGGGDVVNCHTGGRRSPIRSAIIATPDGYARRPSPPHVNGGRCHGTRNFAPIVQRDRDRVADLSGRQQSRGASLPKNLAVEADQYDRF